MGHAHPSTPEQRVQLVSQMIAHAGDYGMVTRLSRAHHISRQTLYTWTAQVRQLLAQRWTAAPAAPKQSLERAILTLLLESHASVRGIALCLAHLGFATVSVGTIHAVIAEAERRALHWMQTHAPTGPRPLALDELYRSRSRDAYLSIVDTASWAVWASAGPLAVDGDSWTLLLWQAQDAGLRFATFVSDGERAITQACTSVAPNVGHHRDVWHVLHRCCKRASALGCAARTLAAAAHDRRASDRADRTW